MEWKPVQEVELAAGVVTGAAFELAEEDADIGAALQAGKVPAWGAVFAWAAVLTVYKEHKCYVSCVEGYG